MGTLRGFSYARRVSTWLPGFVFLFFRQPLEKGWIVVKEAEFLDWAKQQGPVDERLKF